MRGFMLAAAVLAAGCGKGTPTTGGGGAEPVAKCDLNDADSTLRWLAQLELQARDVPRGNSLAAKAAHDRAMGTIARELVRKPLRWKMNTGAVSPDGSVTLSRRPIPLEDGRHIYYFDLSSTATGGPAFPTTDRAWASGLRSGSPGVLTGEVYDVNFPVAVPEPQSGMRTCTIVIRFTSATSFGPP